MRLTDLMHARVVANDGHIVGEVVDVRLVQDGPLIDGWGAALRIQGLVVSHHRAGSNFGYDRAEVRGPLLVSAIVRWRHRHDRWVPWSLVQAHEKGLVQLCCDNSELETVTRLPQR